MSDQEASKELWLGEPFTQRMLERLKAIESNRLKDLLGACRKSQDPAVVAAFIRYEGTQFMKELFAKGEYRDG